MCKILINKCHSVLNNNQHTLVLNEYLPSHHNDADFQIIELEDALNSLTGDYKEALTLYYIVGLSVKEISDFLKEPEGTIKSRLSRARTILRNNYYNDEGVMMYGE